MSRAVTADHILFDECIDAFRRSDKYHGPIDESSSQSFILTCFHVPDVWPLPNTNIHPSIKVSLTNNLSAFICRVDNPPWVDYGNSHLYGIALSAIISFVTGKPCHSTRDDYLCRRLELEDQDLIELSVRHPVLVTGPGAISEDLPQVKLDEYQSAISSLISTLYSLPYKKYLELMQAIRLVHLSLLNKREDFGLSYLLLVSAIESIAQQAIKRESVKQPHEMEREWKKKAKTDPEFLALFSAYKELTGMNSYLKERYVKFITTFAPSDIWEEIIPHPMQHHADRIRSAFPLHDPDHLTKQKFHEAYPHDLPPEMLKKVLEDSYKHRSCFIHRGEQPPHREPTSYNHFFQQTHSFENNTFKMIMLPNYELLLGIAQHSISKWAKSI
ncbi:hypothetical protein ACQKP5_01005 [Pseudomonas vancouverensis]|uniref:hypothetical protein n=1 Tax=Pseudomonas vancouverensis TaxID=95300 RepID=UPI003CFCA28E